MDEPTHVDLALDERKRLEEDLRRETQQADEQPWRLGGASEWRTWAGLAAAVACGIAISRCAPGAWA